MKKHTNILYFNVQLTRHFMGRVYCFGNDHPGKDIAATRAHVGLLCLNWDDWRRDVERI